MRNNVQQPPVHAENPIRGCEQRSCDVGDLTASEVGQLLNEVCGEWPPTALAATVHERTGGKA
jgi:hypothetical protein